MTLLKERILTQTVLWSMMVQKLSGNTQGYRDGTILREDPDPESPQVHNLLLWFD